LLPFGEVSKTSLTKVKIDEVLPLEGFAEAFERMRRNQHFGKIVLAAG
jgi:NADPH:quinone reductase-like Zn-dependent oxidoreductase